MTVINQDLITALSEFNTMLISMSTEEFQEYQDFLRYKQSEDYLNYLGWKATKEIEANPALNQAIIEGMKTPREECVSEEEFWNAL